jgi:hypothetical protein
MCADGDHHGIVIATFYLGDDKAPTLQRSDTLACIISYYYWCYFCCFSYGACASYSALAWMTAEIEKQPEMDGKSYVPERILADDCSGEHLACKVQWPSSAIQICLWHICERNLGAKLTTFVGAQIANKVKLLTYKAAYTPVGSNATAAQSAVMDIMDEVYDALGSPNVGADIHMHPRNIRALFLRQEGEANADLDETSDNEYCDAEIEESDSDALCAWKYLYGRLFKSVNRSSKIFPAFSRYLRTDMYVLSFLKFIVDSPCMKADLKVLF